MYALAGYHGLGQSMFGLKIIASPLLPDKRARQVLSSKVDVTPRFRNEYNEWLRGFFGEEEYAIVAGDTLMCSPNVMASLKLMCGA